MRHKVGNVFKVFDTWVIIVLDTNFDNEIMKVLKIEKNAAFVEMWTNDHFSSDILIFSPEPNEQ